MKSLWFVVLTSLAWGCGGRRPAPPLFEAPPNLQAPASDIHPATTRTLRAVPENARPDQNAEPPAFDPPSAPVGNEAAAVASVNSRLLDVYFAYDRSVPLPQGMDALKIDAALLVEILREFPNLRISVEGHCDERGSAEYNLGLGDHRAAAALDILRRFGVPAERLQAVSYGKERPQCIEDAESCYSRNRRVHLAVWTASQTRSD